MNKQRAELITIIQNMTDAEIARILASLKSTRKFKSVDDIPYEKPTAEEKKLMDDFCNSPRYENFKRLDEKYKKKAMTSK
jgi:hypothetical protein